MATLRSRLFGFALVALALIAGYKSWLLLSY